MKRFWPWLRLLLAFGILAALGFRLGTNAFVDGLRAINAWSVLAALGIGLLTTVFSAWRWCVIARRLGLPLSLKSAVSDYYRGLLLNAVLPAGVLGDVHRAVNHGQRSGDVGRGVRAVVFERFAGQAVLIAAGIAVVFTQSTLPVGLTPSRDAVLIMLVVLAAAAVFVSKNARARRAVLTTWADARVGLLSREALPRVVLLSAATLAGHVALFLVAAKVAGSTASIGRLFPLIVLTLLVMAVPINIGGFGPREAFLAVAFNAAGLGAAQGLTTGVVYGVLALIAALPGVFVLFRRLEKPEVVLESAGQRTEKVLAFAG
ncbi:YbhN family protein [Amycolatopsis sp. NPDC059657]|uniref:lysylphosphatidylglycerol synthase transmembrane domain-containing protein n=1 Tax=Amycolatopsis sp. NPDC059657 TaxID=3346899 RepID=UPI0036734DCF